MSDPSKLQLSIGPFLKIFRQGRFEDLRVRAEGLLPKEIAQKVMEAIEATCDPGYIEKKTVENPNPFSKELAGCFSGSEPWDCKNERCIKSKEWTKCRHNQGFVEDLLTSMKNSTEGDPFFEKVFILFWYAYASAWERWGDSFDFDSISPRLHLAGQVAAFATDYALGSTDAPWQKVFECLREMALQLHHGLRIENAMICNDPQAFQHHSGLHAFYSGKILEKLYSLRDVQHPDTVFFISFANELITYFEPVKKQHEALVQVGNLFSLNRFDPNKNFAEWTGARDQVLSACASLEDSDNFEESSQLRAHMACLDFHRAHVQSSRLTLQEVNGVFNFGFFIEHPLSPKGNDFPFAELKKYFQQKPKEKKTGITSLVNITEDPEPDILESSIAQEHFQNIMLVFNDIQLQELNMNPEGKGKEKPDTLSLTLTPKLYHYALGRGVGMLSFEFHMKELSVPAFYAIKHMASRHSGQYEFRDTQDSSGARVVSRLIDIAKKIILDYLDLYLSFCKSSGGNNIVREPKTWVEVDQTWFTHFEIYRVQDEQKRQLDATALAQHYEYPGIVSYPRADRASLDDWVNLSVEAMQLNNLAPIRAHKGDLYVVSENHSICYLPDDPKFIVRQYGETSKWVFLIRCLMLYCMSESHKVHAQLEKDLITIDSSRSVKNQKQIRETIEEQYKTLSEKRTDIQRQRNLTAGILEHAGSIGVSQYADHGLLLKRVFEEIGMISIIGRLQRMIDGLSATQQAVMVAMEELKARQERLLRQRIELLLLIITSIQIVETVDVIYGTGTDHKTVLGLIIFSVTSIIVIYFAVRAIYPKQKLF